MRRLLLACLLGFCFVAFGCQTSNTAPTMAPDQTRLLGYQTSWLTNLNLPDNGRFSRAELLDDKLVLFESADRFEQSSRTIYCIQVSDGQVLWRTVLPGGKEHPIGMARQQKTLLVNSETRLYSLDIQNGQLINMVPLTYSTITGPAVYQGLSLFVGLNGNIFSQDMSNGFSSWEYQLSDSIFVWPLLIHNTAFVVDRRGVMVLMDAKDGKLIWRRQPVGAIHGQPTAGATTIFVPTLDNKLLCLNRITGRDNWVYRNEQGFKDGPIVVANLALQTLAQSQQVVAIDASSGKELWQVPGVVHSALPHPKGIILARAESLTLVDAKSGQTIRQVTTQPTQKIIAGPNSSILLIGQNGQILRVDEL